MRRQFKPEHTKPRDFDLFWQETLSKLEKVDPDPIIAGVEHSPNHPELVLEYVEFVSLDDVRITGLLTHWKDDLPRPLVVYSHGYGSQCMPQWSWASSGLNCFGVDIRGFGRSHDALREYSHWGWVLTGIQAPESSVIRGAVCDYIQGARVAEQLLPNPTTHHTYQGVSFAGALALKSASVLGSPDLLAVGVPTFGWTEGRYIFVKSGSGAQINHYLANHPERLDDVMLVMRYFDPVNFADGVHCPALIGLGLKDDVVPAKTVYAIANHLVGKKEIMEFPVSHTDLPEERLWERFEQYWLTLTIEGISEDFGSKPLHFD
ncbi:MAG: acetylxylan esterase [Candidatus Thiodiazotropha sp. (ex Cardiolucina cf. quadrata)]|nr:acetylxylan esterase [Candidatus Thiodiazotropha sp. (ex Cardiolucina cf. quadrata)]